MSYERSALGVGRISTPLASCGGHDYLKSMCVSREVPLHEIDAGAVLCPPGGRPNFFKPRALSAPIGVLSRVGRLAGGDRFYGTRIFLRDKPPSNPAQDEAESFESVCVISPFRHVPKHGEDGVRKVRKVLAKAGTRYARCS